MAADGVMSPAKIGNVPQLKPAVIASWIFSLVLKFDKWMGMKIKVTIDYPRTSHRVWTLVLFLFLSFLEVGRKNRHKTVDSSQVSADQDINYWSHRLYFTSDDGTEADWRNDDGTEVVQF